MFQRLGGFVARHWLLVIVAWSAVAVALHAVAPRWNDVTRDGDLAYLPSNMTSVRGEALFQRAFPEHRSKSQIVIVCERPDKPLASDDLRALDRLAGRFDDPDTRLALGLIDVWTPWSEIIGKKLTSRDRHAALVVLLLKNEFMAVDNIRVLSAVRAEIEGSRRSPEFPPGLNLEVSGSAAVGGDMLGSAEESIRNTEFVTVLSVIAILLLVYRAPVLVTIPLATIVLSVFVSLDLVAQLTQINQVTRLEWVDFKVFKTTKIFIVVILFGSGTDFCLFLISRYKEELQQGLPRAEAVTVALGRVGEALAGSAATTIVGLGTLAFADFGKYRNSGPAIALCLAVTLAACLTLAPALLRALGRAVFWPFGLSTSPRRAAMTDAAPSGPKRSLRTAGSTPFGGFWRWLSGAVVAHPLPILVASVLLLAPFAYHGLSVPISYNLLEELRDDRPSVVGTKLLRRHFYAGDTGPITVLARRGNGGFGSKAGDAEVARVTKLLAETPGIHCVRSITEPLGDRPGYVNPFTPAGQRKLAVIKHPRTQAIYLTQNPELQGDVTRLDVVLKHDPFSRDAVRVLDEIDRRLLALVDDEASFWHGGEFLFAGTTAGVRDLMAVTQSDQTVIQRAVVIAVLMVLVALVRRPLVCGYLILSVLFSYLVTIGATQWVFARLYPAFDGLDWKVPIFLFVILTAVGEDYNIFLMTRVFEEQRRWGLMKGLRIAVEKTGGIITSCGIIMAGTFVSMTFGTLRGILELGFALSLGIVLDTLIVRPVLVPAFLALVYRHAAASRHPAGETRPLALPAVPPAGATGGS
jgi:RND superfamily putative drug exporter